MHAWDRRANFGIFRMIIVNPLSYSKLTPDRNETQEDYYQQLKKEIIDNFYDDTRRRSGRINEYTFVGRNLLMSLD